MSTVGPEILDREAPVDQTPRQDLQALLLKTKLFVPVVQSTFITRPRLFEQLQSGLDKALILVTAPAGYGKTTLVSSWLRETRISSTWLSLDDDDNDPVRFLQYFIAALHQVIPAVQFDLLAVLQERRSSPYIALINILINVISEQKSSFVLVLDDFQTLQSQPVLLLFNHLIEHLPPQMHIVLLSRVDPPIPSARLRARNQLIDIRAEQLRFSMDEASQFLTDIMALKLSLEDINALEMRTEGWIAGLQLAAISMLDSQDAHGFVSAFTGSHHYIMDYLAEEVLKQQPEPVRLFLLRTSILERMCGSLCDAVVAADQAGSERGQVVLESLAKKNLFIIPLDSERHWYRYHHLFADVLNRHLEQAYPDLIPSVHRQASDWYEQNGAIFYAIHHALRAGDRERAAKLLDQHGCALLISGEVVSLLRWIEAVEPYSQTLPWIAIQKGWALCLAGQFDQAEAPLQKAEQLIRPLPITDDVKTMLGTITTARAYKANYQGKTGFAERLARQALDDLPASNDFSCSLRSAATSILGDASRLEGHLVEAEHAYTDAVRIGQVANSLPMTIIAYSDLADVLMEQGQMQRAARIYAQMLKMAVDPDGQVSPLVDNAYAGLGRIAYERNQLEDAAKFAHQWLESAQHAGNSESEAACWLLLAELEQAKCSPEMTENALEAAERLIIEQASASWQSIWHQAALARLWIVRGDLEKADAFIQRNGVCVHGMPTSESLPYLKEPVYITLLHLHLARGDYDSALTLSDWLLQRLDAKTRAGRVIEIMALRALAFQAKRDIGSALAVLERAVGLAQPEGYMQVFLNEGDAMAKLLYQLRLHLPESGYVADLLSSFGSRLPSEKVLSEPLTERELEVLRLIEAGYANQEIAAKLVISLPTVKRHISNIYAKLGANSRTQAILRGKELHLVG